MIDSIPYINVWVKQQASMVQFKVGAWHNTSIPGPV